MPLCPRPQTLPGTGVPPQRGSPSLGGRYGTNLALRGNPQRDPTRVLRHAALPEALPGPRQLFHISFLLFQALQPRSVPCQMFPLPPPAAGVRRGRFGASSGWEVWKQRLISSFSLGNALPCPLSAAASRHGGGFSLEQGAESGRSRRSVPAEPGRDT